MREPLAGLLMRALYASGRLGAALEVYEQTRKRLADQLGVDPSAELAALHLEILRDEPARSIPSSARVSPNRLTSPSVIIEYVMPPCCDQPLTPNPDPADGP